MSTTKSTTKGSVRKSRTPSAERQRLAGIIDSANLGTWEVNIETGKAVFNERWAGIVGYTLEELAPVSIETWRRLAHPDDLQASDALLARHFSGELAQFECEVRMRHKDGSWVWVLAQGRVSERTAEGKPLLMHGVHTDITARKQSEATLAQQRQLLDTVFASAPGFLVLKDRQSVYQLANSAFCQFVGKRLVEIIGRTDAELFPPDDAETFRQGDHIVLETGRTVTKDEPMASHEGLRWFQVTKTPVRDAESKITGVLCSVTDITQRKRTEQAISDAALKYRNLFENSGCGTVIIDPNGVFLAINEIAARRMGRPVTQIVGKTLRDFFPPAIAKEYLEANRRIVVTGKGRTYEAAFDLPTGAYVFHICDEPIIDSRGAVMGVQSTSVDITERKQSEAALRLSEDKFAKAFRASPDGFILSSVPDGRIAEVNEAIVHISGYAPEELLGKTTVELGLWMDHGIREQYAELVRNDGRVENFEAVFRAKSGFCHTCLISTEIVSLQTGPHFLSVLRDITAQKRAEAARFESEARFRELFERIPDGVMVVDATTRRFVLGNGQLCRMLGYTLEELAPMDVTGIHPAAALPRVIAEFETVAANESHLAADLPVQRKDGSVFLADILSSHVIIAGRQCVLGLFRDTTERHAAEAMARRWQQVFESAGFSLAHTSAVDNTFLEVNAVCAQERGYTPAELVGKPITTIYPPEVLPVMRERLKNIDQVGHLAFESVHLRKDGSTFPVMVDVTTIKDDAGRPVSRVAYAMDITERKQAEAELRKKHEELQRFADAMVGREMRVIDLKAEINALCEKLGEAPRYAVNPGDALVPAASPETA